MIPFCHRSSQRGLDTGKGHYCRRFDHRVISWWIIMDKDKFDMQRGYCRRLGHDVNFSYCRIAGQGRDGQDVPCFKIFDCWYERFDIQAFMKSHYSPEEIKALLIPPRDKVSTLFELIEKARKVRQ